VASDESIIIPHRLVNDNEQARKSVSKHLPNDLDCTFAEMAKIIKPVESGILADCPSFIVELNHLYFHVEPRGWAKFCIKVLGTCPPVEGDNSNLSIDRIRLALIELQKTRLYKAFQRRLHQGREKHLGFLSALTEGTGPSKVPTGSMAKTLQAVVADRCALFYSVKHRKQELSFVPRGFCQNWSGSCQSGFCTIQRNP